MIEMRCWDTFIAGETWIFLIIGLFVLERVCLYEKLFVETQVFFDLCPIQFNDSFEDCLPVTLFDDFMKTIIIAMTIITTLAVLVATTLNSPLKIGKVETESIFLTGFSQMRSNLVIMAFQTVAAKASLGVLMLQ